MISCVIFALLIGSAAFQNKNIRTLYKKRKQKSKGGGFLLPFFTLRAGGEKMRKK